MLLEVGHLKEGTRSFEVRSLSSKRGAPRCRIREGPEELTLRKEEVGLQKIACINDDHIAEDRWRPSLVDADWHALLPGDLHRVLKAATGEKCTSTTKK